MFLRRILETIVEDLRQYLLLVFLCLISLALFSNRESASLRYIRTGGLEAFGFLESSFSYFSNYFNLYSQNLELQNRNLSLSAEVNFLRNAKYENETLKRLLVYRDSTNFSVRLARVVDRTFSPEKNFIMINIGSNDSISVDMPVVCDKGLVGRIVLVSPNFSLVQLAINSDFKIGVISELSRTAGIITWKGGDIAKASLEYVSLSSKLAKGERLFTTEYSTFANAQTLVGTVSNVWEEQGKNFFQVELTYAVDFTALDYVFVEQRTPTLEKKSVIGSYKIFQSQ
ncbi:MAG: rod shape-determining protein MreC [Chloroherpetonaceae bacterium]|nr:rod shape-determining protein MreC [Chloroherpetonaceae bacterium]